MTCNEDFEDALRCVEPIPNYDDAYRLTIRIDDSLTSTHKSPAKKKPCIIIKDGLSTKTTSAKAKSEDPNFPNSKRFLCWRFKGRRQRIIDPYS